MIYTLDFTSQSCGEHNNDRGEAFARGEMSPPYYISINGESNLKKCLKWNDSGRVTSIKIEEIALSLYKIVVKAEGPSGLFSGSGYLRFVDYGGGVHDITAWDHDLKAHTAMYWSDNPGIKAIYWSNYEKHL